MRREQFAAFCTKLRVSEVQAFAAKIGVRAQGGESDLDYRRLVWQAIDTPEKIDAVAALIADAEKPISETHPWIIDPGQMQKDFDGLPEPSQCSMQCARRIVEDHIAVWGHIPHPDKLKDEIAFFLDIVALQSVRRA